MTDDRDVADGTVPAAGSVSGAAAVEELLIKWVADFSCLASSTWAGHCLEQFCIRWCRACLATSWGFCRTNRRQQRLVWEQICKAVAEEAERLDVPQREAQHLVQQVRFRNHPL